MNIKSFISAIKSTRWFNISKQNFIPQVSIDCVIFGFQDNQLKVLIPKLIYKGDFWALPSGFVLQDEDVDQAAERILRERTEIKNIYLEQFHVFGNANRNTKEFLDKLNQLNIDLDLEILKEIPDFEYEKDHEWFTRRFISICYYALVDINKVKPQKSVVDESIEWYSIHEIPKMIMDHNQILQKALDTLRKDFHEKLNAFNLLPEKFTMKEVQDVYETLMDRTYDRTNFQKMIFEFNILERLEKKYTGAKNKAPYLYRLKTESEKQNGIESIRSN